jgi:cytochrome c biogenesis protein CcmG, thiol:disulfide interchange protein DsbE
VGARTFAITLALLALVGLLAFGLTTKGSDALALGEPVPDSELPHLDGSGSGSLADYRGDWVLVNVWASWCSPCRDESPALQRFQEAHGERGFTVLGVDTEDTTEAGLEFVDEFGLTYPQLHDGPGEYRDELETTGVPESFLVDPDGELALHRPGPVTEQYLRDEVEPLIAGSS